MTTGKDRKTKSVGFVLYCLSPAKYSIPIKHGCIYSLDFCVVSHQTHIGMSAHYFEVLIDSPKWMSLQGTTIKDCTFLIAQVSGLEVERLCEALTSHVMKLLEDSLEARPTPCSLATMPSLEWKTHLSAAQGLY